MSEDKEIRVEPRFREDTGQQMTNAIYPYPETAVVRYVYNVWNRPLGDVYKYEWHSGHEKIDAWIKDDDKNPIVVHPNAPAKRSYLLSMVCLTCDETIIQIPKSRVGTPKKEVANVDR